MRLWQLTDNDLPPNLHPIRDIFLPDPNPEIQPTGSGREHLKQMADSIKQRIEVRKKPDKQLPLSLYGESHD